VWCATEMRRWDAGCCRRLQHGELLLLMTLTMMTFGCQGISTTNDGIRRRTATNAVGKFEILCLVSTIPLPFCRCRSHLPLRRNCRSVANRIESYFCRSVVGGQPISVLVSSSLCIYGKTFPAFPFSPATATVATERKNGSGMVETRH